MKKIIIYSSGERYVMQDMYFGLGGKSIHQEIDLTDATDLEWEKLRTNPHNDLLISTIQKRKNLVR